MPSNSIFKTTKNVLLCFYSLEFESNVFRDKHFSCILPSSKLSFFVKISFFYFRIATWLCYYCYYSNKSSFFKFMESYKRLFHYSGNLRFLNCIMPGTTIIIYWIRHLNIRKRNLQITKNLQHSNGNNNDIKFF